METVTPTVNLGVTTPDAVGGVGNSFGFTAVDATDEADDLLASLEEAKKKMFGDEMIDPKDAPPKDSDDDAEEDAGDDSDDSDMDDEKCMTKKCKKSKKETVEGEDTLEEAKKKCGSEMMDMLKGKGDDDNGDDEDSDDDEGDDDDGGDDEMAMMKKKSKKESTEFFQSLASQLETPDARSNNDGISEYLEDAVFTPKTPGPGEVGFAPEGRIGSVGSYEVGSEEQQALSTNFMGDWETIKDLALGVRENGLQDG
jgi:hypothetical protein